MSPDRGKYPPRTAGSYLCIPFLSCTALLAGHSTLNSHHNIHLSLPRLWHMSKLYATGLRRAKVAPQQDRDSTIHHLHPLTVQPARPSLVAAPSIVQDCTWYKKYSRLGALQNANEVPSLHLYHRRAPIHL